MRLHIPEINLNVRVAIFCGENCRLGWSREYIISLKVSWECLDSWQHRDCCFLHQAEFVPFLLHLVWCVKTSVKSFHKFLLSFSSKRLFCIEKLETVFYGCQGTCIKTAFWLILTASALWTLNLQIAACLRIQYRDFLSLSNWPLSHQGH